MDYIVEMPKKKYKRTLYKAKPKIWSGKLDGYLTKNLELAKKVILKDWDMVFCVDGYEGSGKSVLAQQCAKFLDPTFNINRISFNPDEFVKSVVNSSKHQAIVYDEAYGGMSSRAAMTEINRSLMSVLAEIRQKNLFVFIVVPCFFELDKYAAVWRSRALLHVYTDKNFKRGFFSFYNQDKKKTLYVLGKKFFSYKRPPPNFFGRFSRGYSIDEQEYRRKKLEALKSREDKKKDRVTAVSKINKEQRDILVVELLKMGKKANEIAEVIGISKRQVYEIRHMIGFTKEKAVLSAGGQDSINNIQKVRKFDNR